MLWSSRQGPLKGHTSSDTAKCNVLNGLGRALHNYEDFWSHSNWADHANPDSPESTTNPAGLGRKDQPSFYAFPSEVPTTFPDGLITGCDGSMPFDGCGGRVAHSALNKDNGDVLAGQCHTTNPGTTRGEITIDAQSNFDRAVWGACGAAVRAWDDLNAALAATYGPERAGAMARALTADAPLSACTVSGSATRALRPPVGSTSSSRSVDIQLHNATGDDLTCSTAVLDGGEWSSYPPDLITSDDHGAWRTQSNGVATGTEGSAKLKIGDTGDSVELRWNDPYVGSNSFSCTTSEGYRCQTAGGKGNNASAVFTLSKA